MANSIEVSAKSIDEAIEKGLSLLSCEREDVTVEVIENAKSGFLGIGATPAKILMTVLTEGIEIPEALLVKEEAPATKKKEEKKVVKGEELSATEFLTNVLDFIGCDAKIEEAGEENGIVKLEIVGENLGGIIGRRGETLDALQHLTNLAINRRSNEKKRISLDAENYRAKRSEALEKFALRSANQAIKYKRNRALEPMNAYERHIIHVALQGMENISTSSVGVEPNRRVVINYTGADARPPRRRNDR
ncbi:MAG: protein jag [Oscillospiraceae bacterium]|nr:protein jag [Oscillospiraceae bacterium]